MKAERGKLTGNAESRRVLKTYRAAYCDPTDEKVIYLTFDARFENGNTRRYSGCFEKAQCSQELLLVGNFLETSPGSGKTNGKRGASVSKSYISSPRDMSKIVSKEAFQKELQEVEELYQKITGEEMIRYYRPPQGKYSTDNLQMASELGYKTFFWSLAYVDWIQEDQQPTKEEAFDKLLSRIHSRHHCTSSQYFFHKWKNSR